MRPKDSGLRLRGLRKGLENTLGLVPPGTVADLTMTPSFFLIAAPADASAVELSGGADLVNCGVAMGKWSRRRRKMIESIPRRSMDGQAVRMSTACSWDLALTL